MIDITKAKDDVKEVFLQLDTVVKQLSSQYTSTLDDLFDKLSHNIDKMSNVELRDIMAQLSIEAYNIGIIREQNSLKEACATALYKEGMSLAFTSASGAVEVKKNQAVIETMDKQAVSILFTSISSLLKTKCDEAHRMISVLNSILISRAAEAKQFYNPRNELVDENSDLNNNIGE